jgi:hypothetical protein
MKITKDLIKGLVVEALQDKKAVINENKISKNTLKQIIKEEYQRLLKETQEPTRDPFQDALEYPYGISRYDRGVFSDDQLSQLYANIQTRIQFNEDEMKTPAASQAVKTKLSDLYRIQRNIEQEAATRNINL